MELAKAVTIAINCQNAAFEGDWAAEVCRILDKAKDDIHSMAPGNKRPCYDTNGNRVGLVQVS